MNNDELKERLIRIEEKLDLILGGSEYSEFLESISKPLVFEYPETLFESKPIQEREPEYLRKTEFPFSTFSISEQSPDNFDKEGYSELKFDSIAAIELDLDKLKIDKK